MWDKRKVVLAGIIFTALYLNVTAKVLDMATDAVDDLYRGCRDKALEKVVRSGLLQEELNKSETFRNAWSTNAQCTKLIPGGVKEHTAALWAYVNGNREFRKLFNNEVETTAVNVSTYHTNFHFKSLHFLLTDSINLLQTDECSTVYRAVDYKYTMQKGSTVRFGRFTIGRLNYEELLEEEDIGGVGGVLFNITTCFSVKLDVCKPKDDHVLISPSEVFRVDDIKNINNEYDEIVLMHSTLLSNRNCYIFSRSPADSPFQWFVVMFVFLFILLSD
ncbi:T-cell ecto-ADP-ribosyltransferase 1 [Thalassophryne amazonica]|uniref:T-cell ecto-ADP-ribosyltransferase 1 n=1 Tax=Thalassophryne amazonica TaxID=390379 RepID=UPI001471A1DE|nr:T-cell ecto-ADP-ribosyltransferase 1 [Thalassophryne amazonica]XP_034044694.1 T-cell ecto-ADP-ribosyltransferase 1 [Thalassophryne amazonica]